MMVRILGEGQYNLEGPALDLLMQLDEQMEAAVRANDEAGFHRVLAEVVNLLRQEGQPSGAGHLGESELVLPPADYTLAEARELLGEGEKAIH